MSKLVWRACVAFGLVRLALQECVQGSLPILRSWTGSLKANGVTQTRLRFGCQKADRVHSWLQHFRAPISHVHTQVVRGNRKEISRLSLHSHACRRRPWFSGGGGGLIEKGLVQRFCCSDARPHVKLKDVITHSTNQPTNQASIHMHAEGVHRWQGRSQ